MSVMGVFPISRQWRKHIRNMIFLTQPIESDFDKIVKGLEKKE